MPNTYPPPVDTLLTLGEPDHVGHPWMDYRALGINDDHIPELVRMLLDYELSLAAEDNPLVWAPMHAWRALGKLRAVEAVDAILEAMEELVEDDWANEELPEVLELIGEPALPTLASVFKDPEYSIEISITVAMTISHIGVLYPETRERCVSLLGKALSHFEQSDRDVNGFLVLGLIDLQGRRAESIIRMAYITGNVEETICGGLEEAMNLLGVGEDTAAAQEHRARIERSLAPLREYLAQPEGS